MPIRKPCPLSWLFGTFFFCAVLFSFSDAYAADRSLCGIRLDMLPREVREACPALAATPLVSLKGPDGKINALRLRTTEGYLGGGFLEAIFAPGTHRCIRAVENIRRPECGAPLDPLLNSFLRKYGPYDDFRAVAAEDAMTYYVSWSGQPALDIILVSGHWLEVFAVLRR